MLGGPGPSPPEGVVGLVDVDPARKGERLGDLEISHLSELEELVRTSGAQIGVVATPADAAQDVCDRLVECGITSVLNFAPAVLTVPDGVDVRKVDLAVELQILAFHEQRKAGTRAEPSDVAAAEVVS